MQLKQALQKNYKFVLVLLLVAAGSFVSGRYLVPPQITTETKTVERIVVQQRTYLAANTHVRNNIHTVVERVSMPDGTVVERAETKDKTTTDTSVVAEQSGTSKSDAEATKSTIIAAPKSSVSALIGTNLSLDPLVGLSAATPAGPLIVGGWLLVPTNKPAEAAVGISVGVNF